MSKLLYNLEIPKDEHDSGTPNTKRVSLYGWDVANAQKVRLAVNPDGSLGDPLPTSGNNPSTALSYDGNGDLQYIDETINGVTYRTTLTYTARVLVGISEAVAQ